MGTPDIVELKSDSGGAAAQSKHLRVLYLTFDGILEPLGRSQVLRYVRDLSRRGFRYTILSLERARVMENIKELSQLEKELSDAAIGWIHLTYRSGSFRAVAGNLLRAFRAARRLVHQRQIQLIHARSYVAAGVALGLRLVSGVPYIFDARGYWIDERATEGRWFTNRFVYSTGKWIERLLLRHAAGVVTLTRLMADDLRSETLKGIDIPVAVIPTCTDYEEFSLAQDTNFEFPMDVATRLQSKLVVGMVGSVNASYCMDESLMLFEKLLALRPDAHLLCVSQQAEVVEQRLSSRDISQGSFTIVKAQHRDMPSWLRCMDWAFLMLHETFAKRGSMPTKLGELLASGVRPIQYGCNREIRDIVERCGSGIVLGGISQDDLDLAARAIAAKHLSRDEVVTARQISREWFDVDLGVARYEQLLNEVVQKSKLKHRSIG